MPGTCIYDFAADQQMEVQGLGGYTKSWQFGVCNMKPWRLWAISFSVASLRCFRACANYEMVPGLERRRAGLLRAFLKGCVCMPWSTNCRHKSVTIPYIVDRHLIAGTTLVPVEQLRPWTLRGDRAAEEVRLGLGSHEQGGSDVRRRG